MFGSLGAPELLIIGAVIILIFGVGKISGLGRELGSSIKEFRRAVKDEDKDAEGKNVQKAQVQVAPPQQYSAPPAAPQQPPAQPTETKNPNVF